MKNLFVYSPSPAEFSLGASTQRDLSHISKPLLESVINDYLNSDFSKIAEKDLPEGYIKDFLPKKQMTINKKDQLDIG